MRYVRPVVAPKSESLTDTLEGVEVPKLTIPKADLPLTPSGLTQISITPICGGGKGGLVM